MAARAQVYYGREHGRGGSDSRHFERKNPMRFGPRSPGRYVPNFGKRPQYRVPTPPAHYPNPNPGPAISRPMPNFGGLASGLLTAWQLYELYDGYQQYFRLSGPRAWIPPRDADCYSYYAPYDVPNPSCGFRQGQWSFGLLGPIDCSTWHYTGQPQSGEAGEPLSLGNTIVGIGPLEGGLFGCERMSNAHVWHFSGPSEVGEFRPAISPLPRNQPEPALDPLPVYKPEPQAPYDPLPYESPIYRGDPVPVAGAMHKWVPPRRSKEKKWKLKDEALINFIGGLYGTATEVVDFLDAVGSSLDTAELRAVYRRQKTLQDKARMLWRNWRHVRKVHAVYEVMWSNVKDFMIALPHRLAQKAITGSGYWYSPRGPGLFHRSPFIRVEKK